MLLIQASRVRPGPERRKELFDFKKENQAENTLYLERSGSAEQAVRGEIYVCGM